MAIKLAQITICIPAYSSHDFIIQTLQSVKEQTFTDFVVHIAIEPTPDHKRTLDICNLYSEDPRFCTSVNDNVLGWAHNIGSLLKKVSTPFFVILLHDDAWHTNYLLKLSQMLKAYPEAAVAYADMQLFGHRTGLKSLAINNSTLFERLLSFFHAGAEAVPWRGLTRSDMLSGKALPTNSFDSFAVECEWALYLLTCGTALRVPEPLYLKRTYAGGSGNVSDRWRSVRKESWIRDALDHHQQRLLGGIVGLELSELQHRCLVLACKIAVLRRAIAMASGHPSLSSYFSSMIDPLRTAVEALPDPYAAPLLSRLHFLKGRAHKLRGDVESSLDSLYAAVELDPENWEALAHLSLLCARQGEQDNAIRFARRAAAVAPNTPEVIAALEKSGNAGIA